MQSKSEILTSYRDKWKEVEQIIQSTTDDHFTRKPFTEIWSIAEEFDHVIKGASALCSAMKRSTFLLKWKFGKPNRPIRTYDEVKARYLEKLAKVNGKAMAPSNFRSEEGKIFDKEDMLNHWNSTLHKFEQRVIKWSDKNLDNVLLPHPLLGKMMVRELLYFTHFHTEHHRVGLQNKVEALQK